MNVAILTAAGVGSRFGQDVPKQFLSIDDKPLIVYTMEKFQQHPDIDEIAVVCLEGWAQGICKAVWNQQAEMGVQRWRNRHAVHPECGVWIEKRTE